MGIFEKEILKDLNVGDEYTSRQLCIFIGENNDTLVISKTVNQPFDLNKENIYRVLDKYDAFIHEEVNGTYHIPPKTKRIIIVE